MAKIEISNITVRRLIKLTIENRKIISELTKEVNKLNKLLNEERWK